jgi:hypothetical protein
VDSIRLLRFIIAAGQLLLTLLEEDRIKAVNSPAREKTGEAVVEFRQNVDSIRLPRFIIAAGQLLLTLLEEDTYNSCY